MSRKILVLVVFFFSEFSHHQLFLQHFKHYITQILSEIFQKVVLKQKQMFEGYVTSIVLIFLVSKSKDEDEKILKEDITNRSNKTLRF